MQTIPKNVAYYPQDASIDTLRIFPVGNPQGVDVSKILVELSYFEDMYSFVVSGYIILRDGIGLIQKLQLSGKETIKISFGKTRDGKANVTKDFRIYSIPDRKPVGNLTTEYIKLYFCSAELFNSEQTKIVKSYKGKTIHDIIYDIVSNQMRINPDKIKKINFEKTNGIYDFVIPTLKPFEAISWLSTYAKPVSGPGADMLFYETKDGFEFRSLNSLYKTAAYKTYRYDVKNIEAQSFEQKITSVLDYQFVKGFDSLNEIESGTFVNRVMAFDPLNRTVEVKDFDYKKYKGAKLNRDAPTDVTEYINGNEKKNVVGSFKLVSTNSNQKMKPTLDIFKSVLPPDVFVQETVQNRTSQLALSNYTILKIRIPGDTGLKAGSVINFNILSLDASKEKRDLDKFYSGRYLVTAVRHIIQSQGVFQTVLEITKGSSQAQYDDYR